MHADRHRLTITFKAMECYLKKTKIKTSDKYKKDKDIMHPTTTPKFKTYVM